MASSTGVSLDDPCQPGYDSTWLLLRPGPFPDAQRTRRPLHPWHRSVTASRMLPRVLLACLAILLAIAPARANDPVRLGLLHTLSPAPFYIAQERGYFRDQGIDLTFRFFDAAQPIAAAAVSGDIDVGVTALTGGLFNLAEKGTLKIIGGALHEEKGYEGSAFLVSNAAFDAGLTDIGKLPGHSFAITQYGSSF